MKSFSIDDSKYALEVQQPFSSYLLQGNKTIETRSYPLPQVLINKELLLLETLSNTTGQSILDNEVHISSLINSNTIKVIGIVCFKSCKRYLTYKDWDNDRLYHLVDKSSIYEWNESSTNYHNSFNITNSINNTNSSTAINTNNHINNDYTCTNKSINNHINNMIINNTQNIGLDEKYGWEIAYVKSTSTIDNIIVKRIYRSLFQVL